MAPRSHARTGRGRGWAGDPIVVAWGRIGRLVAASRGVLVFTLGCAVAVGCGGQNDSGSNDRNAGPRALVVRTAPVAMRDVVYTAQALGTLEPEELVRVTAEVPGTVEEVRFQAGDHVTPETVLARIDPERYALETARADAAHRRALADWRRADADLQRREALAAAQLVPVEELNRARQEAERLDADTAVAKAAFELALQDQRRSEVRPPRAGEIDTRAVDTGQFVQVGDVLATLVDTRRLRLRFKVSESESLKAHEGQAVTFRVAALGDFTFTATVYHVGDVADTATRQVEILAWVTNPGALKAGFFAEVTLATETHRNAVVVAESAIQASERGFVTYVVDQGTARQRPVTIGLRTDDGAVEIVSGLAVGDSVVVEGSDRLADGIAVRQVDGPSGSAGAVQP